MLASFDNLDSPQDCQAGRARALLVVIDHLLYVAEALRQIAVTS
jgi:hypothetical protein